MAKDNIDENIIEIVNGFEIIERRNIDDINVTIKTKRNKTMGFIRII